MVVRRSCGLPDYFIDDVPEKIAADLGAHLGWVVIEGADLVGFAVAERWAQGAAEILWMAVMASRRGDGIGAALLDQVLGELWFPADQADLAAEAGWIHVPSRGHELAQLGVR